MKTSELISKAIGNSNKDGAGNWAAFETEIGEIICEVEFARSRTKPKGWHRKTFWIVKPGAEFRSRFSLKKAQEILG